jgi:hypothetical protein
MKPENEIAWRFAPRLETGNEIAWRFAPQLETGNPFSLAILSTVRSRGAGYADYPGCAWRADSLAGAIGCRYNRHDRQMGHKPDKWDNR